MWSMTKRLRKSASCRQKLLSAYEAAAKEIESMGAELLERVKQCETLTRDALGVIDELKDTAKRYREEAKRVFDHIESCSRVVAQVRTTCIELKEKIAVPPMTDGLKSKKK